MRENFLQMKNALSCTESLLSRSDGNENQNERTVLFIWNLLDLRDT
jgi:hypothetical protein